MRIAVFADTHDRCPPSLPGQMRDADEIWHLGDVCSPEVLENFFILGPPVLAIAGNCDSHPGWPLSLEMEREGVRFFLTHIPPQNAPPGVRVVLHGHTHMPRDETIDGVRWLNPGCITGPRGGHPASYAWLTVERGAIADWRLVKV